MKKYHLSVVVTTRNDNHGGSLTYRMQHFVDGFVAQCKKHQLNAELIFVEWNPPQDKPPLARALRFPDDLGPCTVRIIRVPPEIHAQYQHAHNLPLYQMIGKNVGIQRASGEFVLATNIDILFSDKLICFMRDKLKKGCLYRSDRLDVPSQLPSIESFDDLLIFCKANYFRVNGKFGTKNLNDSSGSLKNILQKFPTSKIKKIISPTVWKQLFHVSSQKIKRFFITKIVFIKSKYKKIASLKAWRRFLYAHGKTIASRLISAFFPPLFLDSLNLLPCLHSNACGDFTLLSYDDWKKLRGYPEWSMYSFHLDSVLLFQAHYHGIREIDLPRRMSIYHIEHDGGYAPETEHLLFQRLDKKGIPYLRYSDLLDIINKLRTSQTPVVYNNEQWGLSQFELEENIIESTRCTATTQKG